MTVAGISWFDEVRERAPVLQVAQRLGLQVRQGGSFGPCPGCGADRRGKDDSRRGPIGIVPNQRGWHCHRCELTGDAANLAALVLTGDRRPTLQVRDWFARNGWCAPSDGPRTGRGARTGRQPSRPSQPHQGPPGRESGGASAGAAQRPDRGEVSLLWHDSRQVFDVPGALAYLEARGLDPALVEDRQLARVLPGDGYQWPWWASHWPRWMGSSPALCVPLWAPEGQAASLLARSCDLERSGADKSRSARGPRAGLVMACGFGREILEAGQVPGWWPEGRPLEVLIAEGEIDFLHLATFHGDAGLYAPVVFGVVAGAWTPDVAARIPTGSKVTIWTDPDDKGDSYAAKVARTLRDRCTLYRSKR